MDALDYIVIPKEEIEMAFRSTESRYLSRGWELLSRMRKDFPEFPLSLQQSPRLGWFVLAV